MSRTIKANDKYPGGELRDRRRGHKHRVVASAVRRRDPDLQRMGKALLDFARSEAEAAAEAQHRDSNPAQGEDDGKRPSV